MQLAMIGVGRMGANMVRRLVRAGHSCVVFDRSKEAVRSLAAEGADARFSSRGEADFADRVLSAMRHAFGGHLERP